ncbi:sialate O-acetylesterase [Gorillibacterium sp. sgz5001074]|uniref:sialate O-acetylesterase n=1 Tax=Gorillibacterium sp. sgz5001074 TaxID=3446695 RepID=UPI003F67052E
MQEREKRECDCGRTLRLPRILSDGMVLQREALVTIWGWAQAGVDVQVKLGGASGSVRAGEDGRWQVVLPPCQAGGPYTMEISAGAERTAVGNILFGDVWVCSGQSNMQIPMARVKEKYAEDISRSANPAIRQFSVPETYDFRGPRDDLDGGEWVPADPERVLSFSAVAYFAALELHERHGVPVGILLSAVGGSPVESWIGRDALQAYPELLQQAAPFEDPAHIARVKQRDEEAAAAWYGQVDREDAGLTAAPPWYASEVSDHPADGWSAMSLPSAFADEGLPGFCGSVWFRKTVEVPAEMCGLPAKLRLGTIVDSDAAYVNGTLVGTTGYQYPPRIYDVPGEVLREGRNVIAIRVICNNGQGAFTKDKPFRLEAGNRSIPLAGEWSCRVGAIAGRPLPATTFIQWKPTGLYNGMIAPLLKLAVKGVFWYQGESNAERPGSYRDLFTTLMREWRRRWNREDLPFLFVQLPNFMEARPEPSESHWAELREAQLQALELPHTGMAVAIDAGEWNDIHPLDKKTVGHRLARAAGPLAYATDEAGMGPLLRGMRREGRKLLLSFAHAGGGLVVRGSGKLKHFAVAGDGTPFVWAEAEIHGDEVAVWSDRVPEPRAVRYAWADNPEGANLYSREGLPASPFRTDAVRR